MEIDQENAEIVKLSDKVNELRVKLRENLIISREQHRSLAFDKNRFLETEILTENDVKGLCSRIKRRKHASEEDLIKLFTAFYQCEANISSFIKITGAINVIIKEFIHSDRQLLAAQTICNLSLGNDVCCSKIAVFAGAYLMIYLRNLTHVSLNKICIWTLQNLVSSNGQKTLDILMSQELLANTLYLLNNSGDLELQHEAIQLLDLIIEKKWMSLSMDEKEETTKSVLKYIFKNSSSDHIGLQSLLRILISSYCLNKEDSIKLLHTLCQNITKLPAEPQTMYFSIKIISISITTDQMYLATFLEILMSSNAKLSDIVNEAVKVPKFFNFINDFIRFVGLIFSCEQPVALNYLAFDDIVNNLQIPKMFEF